MSTWMLVLTLFSSSNGSYVQSFASEKECVAEMNKFVRKNDGNADVRYIGCAPADLAMNEDE
jgi:hypothetical protein